MPKQSGYRRSIPPPRRVTIDMLDLTRNIPTIPVQREMNVAKLARLREQLSPRPSWCAIFLRAKALLSSECSALRRIYVGGWRPHLYESPMSIAMVAVERDYHGEPVVFIGRLHAPENLTLAEIDQRLNHFSQDPIESIGMFKRTILLGRMPRILRRFILRKRTRGSGQKRAERSGTFGVSVYSALGAESLHPLAPVTALLNYGVIGPDGSVPVRIVYDHRVTDGAVIARALVRLDEILNSTIAHELETMILRVRNVA